MSDTIEGLKEAEKEAMNEESHPRRGQHHRGDVKGGLILIGIGTIFLISQITGWYIQNWWALFIFIPAIFQLNDAWKEYRANGRLTHNGRGSLFGGLLIGTVASFFLFSISWNLFWPLVLILAGIGALLNGRS